MLKIPVVEYYFSCPTTHTAPEEIFDFLFIHDRIQCSRLYKVAILPLLCNSILCSLNSPVSKAITPQLWQIWLSPKLSKYVIGD